MSKTVEFQKGDLYFDKATGRAFVALGVDEKNHLALWDGRISKLPVRGSKSLIADKGKEGSASFSRAESEFDALPFGKLLDKYFAIEAARQAEHNLRAPLKAVQAERRAMVIDRAEKDGVNIEAMQPTQARAWLDKVASELPPVHFRPFGITQEDIARPLTAMELRTLTMHYSLAEAAPVRSAFGGSHGKDIDLYRGQLLVEGREPLAKDAPGNWMNTTLGRLANMTGGITRGWRDEEDTAKRIPEAYRGGAEIEMPGGMKLQMFNDAMDEIGLRVVSPKGETLVERKGINITEHITELEGSKGAALDTKASFTNMAMQMVVKAQSIEHLRELQTERTAERIAAVKLEPEHYRTAAFTTLAKVSNSLSYGADERRWSDMARVLETLDKAKDPRKALDKPLVLSDDATTKTTVGKFLEAHVQRFGEKEGRGLGLSDARKALASVRAEVFRQGLGMDTEKALGPAGLSR